MGGVLQLMSRRAAERRHRPAPGGEPTPAQIKAFGDAILRRLEEIVPQVYKAKPDGKRTIKERDVRAALGKSSALVPPVEHLPSRHCTRKLMDAGAVDCFFFPRATFRKLVKSRESKDKRLRWTKKSMAVLQHFVEAEKLASL